MKKKILIFLLTITFAILISGTVSADDSVSTNTNGSTVLNTTDSVSTTAQEDISEPDPIISGTVTHCSNGEPFTGVTITVNSMDDQLKATTTTDANGIYSVAFIDSNTVFKVTASYPGHTSSTQEVTVTKNPAEPTDPNYYGTANFQLGMDNVYISTTGSDTTGTGTEANPYASLSKGVTETNSGGTLHVASGTYTGSLNRGIIIDKSMTIQGQATLNTIINAESLDRIFTINNVITVTIQNLTLTNGFSDYGGTINNGGTLTVTDSTFIDNIAIYSGGAINTDYGTLNVTNCTFTGNTANSGDGGAINTIYGTLNVTNCTFTGNTANSGNGGAIRNSEGDWTVTSSTFTTNNADIGGAIRNGGTLTVTDSTFTENSANAHYGGGAIRNGGILTVTDSTFEDNTTTGHGGAISNSGILIVTGGTTFVGNNSNIAGGAIYNEGTLTVNSSTFTANLAIYGGAIFIDSASGTVTVTDCMFEDNTATNDGGAILNAGDYGTVTVTDCMFEDNTATNDGGAIYNYGDYGTLTVNSSTFTNNTAIIGGAIYNYIGILTACFNRFIENPDGSGYEIYSFSGSVNAENNWWGTNANPTSKVSGAVDVDPWIKLVISASPTNITTYGTSTVTADLIHNSDNEDTSSQGLVPAAGLPLNFSQTGGQGIDPTNPSFNINNMVTSIFTASYTTGTAYVYAVFDGVTVSTPITISLPSRDNIYVATTGNDTTGDGGQTHPYQTINKGTSEVNSGGIVHIANGTYTGVGNRGITIGRSMTIHGENQSNTIIDAESLDRIFIINNVITVTIQNLTLTNGFAVYGGTINNGGTLTVTDSTFIDNIATNSGGAILNSGNLSINSSTFENNAATNSGGAIYNSGSLTAHFNRFIGNSALSGYDIYCYSGSVNAENNWWGSNADPTSKIWGAVDVNPWLVLTVNASPDTIPSDDFSTVSANLIYDSGILSDPTHPELYYHDPALGHVPDGTPITFQTSRGSYLIPIPTTLMDGQATATFSSQDLIGGPVTISVTIDSETYEDTIQIDGVVTNMNTLEVFNTITAAIQNEETINGHTLQVDAVTLIENDINITKNLTITGTGLLQTIIDANNVGRIFFIGPSITVNLNNLVLRNGATNVGGAIYNYGTLNLTNCNLTNNTATSGGGAIYNNVGNLTVTDSNFTDNTATNNGGAISNYGGTLTVNSSTFEGNTAANGGAIYNVNGGIVQAHFNRFIENLDGSGYEIKCIGSGSSVNAENNWWGTNDDPASKVSGAVDVSPWIKLVISASPSNITTYGTSTVTADLIHNSDNVDTSGQGLVPTAGLPLNFSQTGGQGISPPYTSFNTNNMATSIFTASYTPGTAYATVLFDGVTVSAPIIINLPSRDDIYVDTEGSNITGDGSLAHPYQTINKGTSEVNIEGIVHIAEGIYPGDGNQNIIINWDMRIQGERQSETIIDAESNAGIFTVGSGITVTINHLTLQNGLADYGGAIYNEGTLNVTDCTFYQNTANYSGGAISNFGFGTLNVTASTFTYNTAEYGGAIYSEGLAVVHFNRFIKNPDSYDYDIYSDGSMNAENNWWGTNDGPESRVVGEVDFTPWLYMTLTADPVLVLYGSTSTITASFNNTYDGTTVTPINPASGHLPDYCSVTFTTDLGNVGSKTTIKDTNNGLATATLTANDGTGTANISAELDNQTINTTVAINLSVSYVNGTAGDDTYDGSSSIHTTGIIGPKQHIQAAINITASGGTVNVADGTYLENILLDRSLILQSAGAAAVQALAPNQPVFTINPAGNGSTIQSFNITGASSSFGVYLASTNNCNLIGNTISGNFIGVYIQNSNTNTVSGNTIQNNGWVGVCLDNSGSNMINGGNVITGNGEGIYIVNTSNGNTITGNNIYGNSDAGISILSGPTGNIIGSNTAISYNGVIGVLIRDSDTNTITGNNIQNNGWVGVTLDNADGNTIKGSNSITGNLEGLNITNSNGNTITGNTITGNTNIGISIINSSTGNYITSNTSISNNGVIGVYLRESSTNTISGNTIQINSWAGICFDQATGNTINGANNISSNLEGLYIVNNSNNNTITANNIHENADTGIYIDGSTRNIINGSNTISSNGVIGILLRGANTNTIVGNTLAGNTFSGIALDNASSNIVNGSNVVSGSQMGVYVTNNSTGNTVTGNTLQNNTWAGLVLDYANNTTVYQNNFQNNPLQAMAQNGSGNAFYQDTTGNYWSDWIITDPRSIYGNEGLYDEYISLTPFPS